MERIEYEIVKFERSECYFVIFLCSVILNDKELNCL